MIQLKSVILIAGVTILSGAISCDKNPSQPLETHYGGHVGAINKDRENRLFAVGYEGGWCCRDITVKDFRWLNWMKFEIPTPVSIAVDSNDCLFVGPDLYGIYRSVDHGQTWEQVKRIGTIVSAIEINSSGKLFAVVNVDMMVPDILIGSEDSGDTWFQIGKSWEQGMTDMEIDRDDIVYISNGYGLFYSKDDGQTWEQANPESIYVFDIAHTNRDGILCGTRKGVYHYSIPDQRFAKLGSMDWRVNTCCVDFNDTIWIGVKNELYGSTDSGKTWTKKHAFDSNIESFYCKTGDRLLIGTSENGIFEYTGNSAQFEQIGIPVEN